MDYELGRKLDGIGDWIHALRNSTEKQHFDLDYRMWEILFLLRKIDRQEIIVTQELDALKGKITALETAVDKLIDLAGTLAADFAAAKEDPVEIQALADSVQGEIDKVTAALDADTPVVPQPV